MISKARTVACAALALSLIAGPSPAAEEKPALRLVKRFPYKGGLEISSAGKFVYASQWNGHYDRVEKPSWGGVRIFDVSGRVPRQAGFLKCPGYDNDVAALEPGLIAVGYGENSCARTSGRPGVLFADVSNPSRPRLLGDVGVYFAHTISAYPGKRLIYASPGGWLPADNEGRIDIIDASNPRKPKVVGNFTFDGFGCHDISFRITKESKLAFCTTSSPVQLILDVSKPTACMIVGRIVNPLIQYGHTAIASPDGRTLAITDEAFIAHECVSGASAAGGLWLYDISDPALPELLGYRAPSEGREPVGHLTGWTPSYCTAAMLDWMTNERLIVSWYSGGVEVLDVADPASPRPITTYRPESSLAYGVDFYKGRVYVNDIDRGLEVLEPRGMSAGR